MLYQKIASKLAAIEYLKSSTTHPYPEIWIANHTDAIERLVNDNLPSGSGFDSGTKLDFALSKPERLVFTTAFHHMNDGTYTKWTSHTVIVTPSLASGFNLRVTGRDHNNIKDYITDCFNEAGAEE